MLIRPAIFPESSRSLSWLAQLPTMSSGEFVTKGDLRKIQLLRGDIERPSRPDLSDAPAQLVR
jgi:hypothetical protein